MSAVLPDLSPIFDRYEALVSQADALFKKIHNDFPKELICKEGCSSCCYAVFDLSLVEALYINTKFNESMTDGVKKYEVFNRADEVDRKTTVLKRSYFQELKDGAENDHILSEVAKEKMRCPLLDENDLCILYEFRPITCRLYGVPTAIGAKAHSCGKTGFEKGKAYPTVRLDKIQDRLSQLSLELAEQIQTSFSGLHTIYVPVSSALITTYDASYLGVGGSADKEE